LLPTRLVISILMKWIQILTTYSSIEVWEI
jgi:hypothetical protein